MKVLMKDRCRKNSCMLALSSRSSLMGECSRRSWNDVSIDPMISTCWWKIDHTIGSWSGGRPDMTL